MFEQITSIPGYQVYIWLLSILGSAAIHLRVRGDYSRPAVVETLLIYLAGVGGFISIIRALVIVLAKNWRNGVGDGK